MADQLTVVALKGFDNGGTYVKRGTEITVSELRARELERNGLISRDAKRAQVTQNKMAPKAANKGKRHDHDA